MFPYNSHLGRQMVRFVTHILLPAVAFASAAAQQTDSGIVSSRDGMVVSTSSFASDVGAAILKRGGNAVDAAVATAFALAVTHPSAGNIGGGGFMVVRPKSGAPITIDYRERAPSRSTQTMYLDSTGRIARQLTATGYLAPGVPGTVAGLYAAHSLHGKLLWKDVVMPAANLAANGFVLSAALARSLNPSSPAKWRNIRRRSRHMANRAADNGPRATRSA
jgi:gamma-glutamyltranspeptidase/glutathione hydrolase